MTDNHLTSERAELERQVRAAIPAAGYRLRDDSPGWGRDFWAGNLEHPGGFDADLLVEPLESQVCVCLKFGASSEEEWRAVERVIEDLRERHLFFGYYRNAGYPKPYILDAVATYRRAFEHESFCAFLRCFAEDVMRTLARLPQSDGHRWP
jgi:hypothetical protein